MKKELLVQLRSPAGNPLSYDALANQLIDNQTNEYYEFAENVPILLPKDAMERCMEVTMSNGMRAKLFYLNHYEQDAAVFDYFEAFAHPAAQHENERLHQMILSKIPASTQSILDVGCGSAWVARHFADQDTAVYSMDVSATNPVTALKKYPFEKHFGVVGDAYTIPFASETFDCVIAAEVMEHTPDPKLFITNLLKVLKPGGTLIVTTPYKEQIPYSLCVHCNQATPHNAHVHTFDAQKISKLLSNQPILNWKINTFANKWLVKLRSHILLQYLPFNGWRAIDFLANKLYNKPLRLLLQIEKS